MKILIIRLSAMGDVALSVPVVKALSNQHHNIEICLLTRKLFNPFFSGINNLKIINPDLNGKHKGLHGLFKLYKDIKSEFKPDVIIDIHDVLRTRILRAFFKFSGIKSYKIDKGRKEKKLLTKKHNKTLKQLKHTTQRYADTLLKAGINIKLDFTLQTSEFSLSGKANELLNKNKKKIGIAPFAKHLQKQYPIEKSKEVIQMFARKEYQVYIFGGDKTEKKIAEEIQDACKNVISLPGKLSLQEEIACMDHMDLMISMDSANMHIAALTNTKIVSIWGATHPFAGFTPFISKDRFYIIQNEELNCRPCSVFGNKPCYKKTLECFETIKPEKIVEVCEKILNR